MALIDSLTFTQDSDIATGVESDTSDYGVGGNPARSATANYLLWSKTSSTGARSFDNPSQGTLTSNLNYAVNTPVDGYYEAILMRFTPYDNGDAYVEQQQSGSTITQYCSVVYDPTAGAIYKCISPITGVAPSDPSGATYWQVVALGDAYTLIDNPNVDVYIKAEYIKIRASVCVGNQFKSNCGCGCSSDLTTITTPLTLVGQLMAADAEYANGNYQEMQRIIEDITSTCTTCGSV